MAVDVSEGGMAEHFGFTKLVVVDLEASARFYTGVFDLKELARFSSEIADRPIDEIMYHPTAPGASIFVLLTYPDLVAPSSDEVIVGFITTDITSTVARALAAGGSVVREVRDMPEHGVKVGFVRDPEGHLIELVEQLPKG